MVLGGQGHPPIWGFPKGTQEPGETLVQTALREVVEETGLEVQIKDRLGFIRYWFLGDGIRYHKTVHFYLMVAREGSFDRHGPEFDTVQWVPATRAETVLSHLNAVRLLRRAIARIRTIDKSCLAPEQGK